MRPKGQIVRPPKISARQALIEMSTCCPFFNRKTKNHDGKQKIIAHVSTPRIFCVERLVRNIFLTLATISIVIIFKFVMSVFNSSPPKSTFKIINESAFGCFSIDLISPIWSFKQPGVVSEAFVDIN